MISFYVEGIPRPQGSKKAFMVPGMKHPTLVESAGEPLKQWRKSVASVAAEQGRKIEGPVCVQLVFFFPRAKSHFGTGRNAEVLKPSAPTHHTKRPDVDKVTRAVLDALTDVVIEDDSCVVMLTAIKDYCSNGTPPGCRISVEAVQ